MKNLSKAHISAAIIYGAAILLLGTLVASTCWFTAGECGFSDTTRMEICER